jgi:hypothetical protein
VKKGGGYREVLCKERRGIQRGSREERRRGYRKVLCKERRRIQRGSM